MSNQNEELRKALSSLGGSTGAKLIPEVVSSGIRRFFEDASPLYSELTKVDWPTNAYMYREVNAINSTADWKAEMGSLPAASQSTYDLKTVPMKLAYARGEVSGFLQNTIPQLDILSQEVEFATIALIRLIEKNIISGNATNFPDQFTGFKTAITNSVAGGGSSVSLTMLEEALDKPAERPTHLVMKRSNNMRINTLLQAQQRFVDVGELKAGFRVNMYMGLPIITVDPTLASELNTDILLPDFRHAVLAINTPPTFEELAHSSDSTDFMVKSYLTLGVEGVSRYHAKISGLLA